MPKLSPACSLLMLPAMAAACGNMYEIQVHQVTPAEAAWQHLQVLAAFGVAAASLVAESTRGGVGGGRPWARATFVLSSLVLVTLFWALGHQDDFSAGVNHVGVGSVPLGIQAAALFAAPSLFLGFLLRFAGSACTPASAPRTSPASPSVMPRTKKELVDGGSHEEAGTPTVAPGLHLLCTGVLGGLFSTLAWGALLVILVP